MGWSLAFVLPSHQPRIGGRKVALAETADRQVGHCFTRCDFGLRRVRAERSSFGNVPGYQYAHPLLRIFKELV